ncbi:MAG: DUF421 domain-containing protein [Gemmatimonadales bacterium]
MWKLAVPWWELVARALIIYVFMLVILRLTGKRQVGQLAPFDLVLLLILSNAVQNAMNAGDNSVTAGLLLALTLIALNVGMANLTWRSRRLEALFEGKPRVLVHNGKLQVRWLAREKITRHELMAALRDAGVPKIQDVGVAVLETSGHISVQPRAKH